MMAFSRTGSELELKIASRTKWIFGASRFLFAGNGHPGSFWKIAKMALFDLCMEFGIFWATWLHLRCGCLTLSKKCPSAFFLGFLWIPCNAGRQNLRVQTGKISVWTWGLSINSLHHQHVKTSKVILNRISCFILYIDFLLIQLSYLLNITNRCQAFAVMIDLLFDLQMWLCMSKKC